MVPIPSAEDAVHLHKRQPAAGRPPPADCRQDSPAGAAPAAHSRRRSLGCRRAGPSSMVPDSRVPASRPGPTGAAEAPSPPEKALPCPVRSWIDTRARKYPGTAPPDSSPARAGPAGSAARQCRRPSSYELPHTLPGNDQLCGSFFTKCHAFLPPDFMDCRHFCKPKIGCFCASIGCFSDFLQTQSKSNLHNTIIKQTGKMSRMKMEAGLRKNCAAVDKELPQYFSCTF